MVARLLLHHLHKQLITSNNRYKKLKNKIVFLFGLFINIISSNYRKVVLKNVFPKPRVCWKQPLYPTKVTVRYVYTSPSPDPTYEITLGTLLLLQEAPKNFTD